MVVLCLLTVITFLFVLIPVRASLIQKWRPNKMGTFSVQQGRTLAVLSNVLSFLSETKAFLISFVIWGCVTLVLITKLSYYPCSKAFKSGPNIRGVVLVIGKFAIQWWLSVN